MNHKIIQFVKKYELITKNDKIVIAVSGGSDSMALLHFIIVNKTFFGISDIVVCHVNHMLRGEDSNSDQRLVEDFCGKYDIVCNVLKVDINDLSKRRKQSVELVARNERYNFFGSYVGYKIATAHNSDDSIETFLYNAIRGTSLKGLCGIHRVRNNIIRPLLCVDKSEVNTYCIENGVPFCIDKTNFDNDYTRNKIRNTILPLFVNINVKYKKNLGNLISSINTDSDYLEKISYEEYTKINDSNKINVKQLLNLHPAISKRCIRFFLDENGLIYDSYKISKIYDIICRNKGRINIEKNIYVAVYNGLLYTYKNEVLEFSIPIKIGTFQLSKYLYCDISIIDKKKYQKIEKKMFHCCLDYDKIEDGTLIRNRKVNDYISFKTRNVSKTLKKFFIEEKVPQNERNIIPMVVIKNRVINIPFYMTDENFGVTKNTENILYIQYRRQ